MSCEAFETYKELIQRFTDGSLSEQETQSLKRHCLTCPDCAVYLREMTAVRDALNGTLEETPPPELHTKIMKKIYAEKRHKTAPFRRFGIAAAAVLVLAVGTVAFFKSPLSPISLNSKSADAANESFGAENDSSEAQTSFYFSGAVNVLDSTEAIKGNAAGTDENANADSETESATADTTTAAVKGNGEISAPAASTTTSEATKKAPEPFEEYSDTLDKKSLALVREHLDEWTAETLNGSEKASFVEVVHMEMIPVELEHDDYRAEKFGVEDVSIVLTFGTEAELGGIIEEAYPDWTYRTNDLRYVPALDTSAGAENGLFIIIAPSGT